MCKIQEKFIKKQLEKLKNKSNLMTSTITGKLFDNNLLTALQSDFHKIIDLTNQNILSDLYIYQILKLICEKENIIIPDYIKNHFRLEK